MPSPCEPLPHPDAATLLRAPTDEWRPPEAPTALRYTLEIRLAADRTDLLRSVTGHSPALDHEAGPLTRLQVVHGGDMTRIEATERGVFGRAFVYLSGADQGAIFLDPGQRRFLRLGRDQIPAMTPLPAASARLGQSLHPAAGPTKLAQIDLHVGTGREAVRVRLSLSPRKDLQAFARAIVCMTLGCPDRLQAAGIPVDEILRLGVPVRGETFTADSDAPVSSFELQAIALRPLDRRDFAVPSGYTDLRGPRKDSPQTLGRPIRASETRGGRGEPATNSAGKAAHRAPGRTAELPDVCQCLPATYGSQIAAEVEQKLCDDLRFVANHISRRLGGFTGKHGRVKVDWLTQFAAHAAAHPASAGLYCFLRDAPKPASDDPVEQLGGRGVLDKLAERAVRDMLGALRPTDFVPAPPVGFSLADAVIVPSALADAILAVLDNPAVARDGRYDALSLADRRMLREAWLDQNLGRFTIPYPADPDTQSIFHDLLNIKVQDIEFDIRIDNTEIVDTLDVGSNLVHLVVKLPKATGKAFLKRWPGKLYWQIAGLGVLGCLFVPGLCALLPLVASVGVFLLLDLAYVSIAISDFVADARISWTPDDQGALQPGVALTLDATVVAHVASVIPAGVQQIFSLITTLVATHTEVLLDSVAPILANALRGFLRNTLKLSFPPKFGPVSLTGLASTTGGSPRDHLYLGAELDAGLLGVLSPYITQVDTQIQPRLIDLRQKFHSGAGKGLHHWGGMVLSQNFINHYIHTLWRQGEFSAELGGQLRKELAVSLTQLNHECAGFRPLHVHLCPAVSPRLVVLPCRGPDDPQLACFFDDLRLCITGAGTRADTIELQFSARVNAELGFGGISGETGKLDLIKIGDRFVDVYFDLGAPQIELTHPDTFGHATSAGCTCTLTCEQLTTLHDLLVRVVALAWKARTTAVIPRGADDPREVQRYALVGQDIVVQHWTHRGNIYVHAGVGGPILAVLDGGLDLDAITCAGGEFLRGVVDIGG